MQTQLDDLHRDRKALEAALERAGARFKGNQITCPFHDDKNPSGGIYRGEKGQWRFKCHGCGFDEDVIGVRAKVDGKAAGDVIQEILSLRTEEEKPQRVFYSIEAMLQSVNSWTRVESNFVYTNPDTHLPDAIVIRCRDNDGKKKFLQAKPVDGGFVMKSPPKPLPLYNRARVRDAKTVIVCEGEKCVHAIHDVGYVATTSMMGAGKSEYTDWAPLAGKIVYLWPDNDTAGLSHMRDVAELLRKLKPLPTINWIDPQALKLSEKGDVVDYLELYGGTTTELKSVSIQCAMDAATCFGPSASVKNLIDATVEGRRYAVEWPWPILGMLTNALLPGTVTAICGDPAASKSFFLLQAARFWHERSIMFGLYQLESDEEGSHLLRSLVQHANIVDLLNWKWIKENPDDARDVVEQHREFLDSFGARLWVPPKAPPNLKDLTDWVHDRAKEGCRIIAVDPITAADAGQSRWDDDRHFILNSQAIVRDYGTSLIIVTHPKLNAKAAGMSDMAGGAAYSRFTQTVLWLRAHEPAKDHRVATFSGDKCMVLNRTIRVSKSRLGRGTGKEIGYVFGDGMMFEERGLIVKPQREEAA